MNSHFLKQCIKERFCSPEFAVFFEVANKTGGATRYADAIAMNLYQSRGLALHGFEIKVSRGDWLSELKNPAKAEEISKFCDHWWIVAPDGLVQLKELPSTWGLLTCKNGKLRQAVRAPKLNAEPLSRQFIAALLRRSSEMDEADLKAAIAKEVNKVQVDYRLKLEEQSNNTRALNGRYIKRLEEIKELTGLDLMTHTPSRDIADAINLVLKAGVLGTFSSLARAKSQIDMVQKQIDEAFQAFSPKETEVHND